MTSKTQGKNKQLKKRHNVSGIEQLKLTIKRQSKNNKVRQTKSTSDETYKESRGLSPAHIGGQRRMMD